MSAKMPMDGGMAIEVRGLSKKYNLYDTPKDRIKEALNPFNKKYHRDFWALKDISFEVLKGTTVGILGRNGSGKSTLLQILASILRPTQGDVRVDGAISALLELGAGFNPEFSGRSNAIFSGMLLGLSEADMRSRMPEIEAFAQIGEFIDQPVKIYSSGMFVRLAFAAAVNVDPDILLIDEALSVGDTKFQQRCFDRMRGFQEAGKTILFVTHDIESVLNHADMAMLMHEGKLVEFGKPSAVSHNYREILFDRLPAITISENADTTGELVVVGLPQPDIPDTFEAFLTQPASFVDLCPWRPYFNENETSLGGEIARIIDVFVTVDGEPFPAVIQGGSQVEFHVKVVGPLDGGKFGVGMHLRTLSGFSVYGVNSEFLGSAVVVSLVEGGTVFSFTMRAALHSGTYSIDIGAFRKDGDETIRLHVRRQVIHVTVVNEKTFDGLVDLSAPRA
jgi:lipopolysaccharide transport system ATP-binding protein